MNKTYRLIWNDLTRTWVAVAETARARGKRAGGTDKEKLRAAIEGTKNFVGVGGVFNMSATDHMGLDLSAFHMVEIKGGHFKELR